jgi:hypothetical protein
VELVLHARQLLVGPVLETDAERTELIRPGVGIGKVRLGMSVAQVKAAMGRHDIGVACARGFGVRYLELTWWSGLADHFTVGLLGRKGAERAVFVSTDRPSERTAGGIGPGVPMTRVARAFPRAGCFEYTPAGGGNTKIENILSHGRTETVFISGGWTGSTSNPHEGRHSAKNLAVVIVQLPSARPAGRYQPC